MDIMGLREIFRLILTRMKENRALLIELDQKAGDGDLGISMCSGFLAAYKALESSKEIDLGRALYGAGNIFNEAAPSSLGTILAIGMKGAARALRGCHSADVTLCAVALQQGCANIMEKAGARPGQKTILDSLCPGTAAFTAGTAAGAAAAAVQAADAAAAGAKATAAMKAVWGRAAYYREGNIGNIDGGAMVGSLIFNGICDYCKKCGKEEQIDE